MINKMMDLVTLKRINKEAEKRELRGQKETIRKIIEPIGRGEI